MADNVDSAMPAARLPGISLATVVRELLSLREQRATGTYYIVSSDNRQVRFGIVDGEVTALSVRTNNLAAALDAIAGLHIARTSFAADGLSISNVTGNLRLSTDMICNELMQRTGRPAVAPAPVAAAPTPAKVQLSAAQQNAIRSALIEYLGPIGDFVYEEHRSASRSLDQLLTNLAQEIPDGRKAEQFLALIRQRLEALG